MAKKKKEAGKVDLDFFGMDFINKAEPIIQNPKKR